MANFHVTDSLTLPGHDDRPNEDSFGVAGDAAFVIDGATGLGPNVITGDIGTDAAWLAEFCRVHFLELLASGTSTRDLVATTNDLAGQLVAFTERKMPIAPWQRPIAGFQMVRLEGEALRLEGLGDCVAFAATADGRTHRISPLADHGSAEIELAREAIQRSGGLKPGESLPGGEATLAIERALRATFNTSGGPLWTLGCEPEAGHHVQTETLHLNGPVTVLLCTDGFAALADKYHRYNAAALINDARDRGLEALAQELRHIERHTDPHGHRHPRMKVSDDATALLIEVAP